MNHYPHHIGDFNAATRHLTRVERSLYRDLIELYYDTEQPLPADDFEALARKVMARSEEELAALACVLKEFFELDGDLYRNTRCDAEILIYKGKIDAAQRAGKASALARAKGSLSKRRTAVERPLNGSATNQEPLTTNQEPRTKNQEPRTSKPLGGSSKIPLEGNKVDAQKRVLLKPEFVSEKIWNDFLAVRKAKRAPLTETALHGIEREATKAGMALCDALAMCCERGWQGFNAEWIKGGKNAGNAAAFDEAERMIFGASERDISDESERV